MNVGLTLGTVEPRTRSPLHRDEHCEGFSPVTELLPLFRRVALIGPRGSGRSTFLARLAQQPATGLPAGARTPTPHVLNITKTGELRRISEGESEQGADDGEHLLFLIHGLDELDADSPALRHAFDALAALTARCPAARIVLSAGRHAVAELHRLGFRVAAVEALSATDALRVIRAWHARTANERARGCLRALEASVYHGPLRTCTRNSQMLGWLCRSVAETGTVPSNVLQLSELVAMRGSRDVTPQDRARLEDAALAGTGHEPSRGACDAATPNQPCPSDPRLRGALATRAFVRQLRERSDASLARAAKQLPSLLRTPLDANYFAVALHDAELLRPALTALLSRLGACGELAESVEIACAATALVRAADELGLALTPIWQASAPALQGLLARATTRATFRAVQRAAAAEALGYWGDERHADPLAALGAVTGAAGYELATQLVTVAQFEQFTRAGGYEDPSLWSPAGWTFRASRVLVAPGEPEAQALHPTRPIVHVCWYECEAYCRWLTRLHGVAIELAPVSVWNAAAHHPDGPYPWGAAEPDGELLNSDQIVGECTPVGIYPCGQGPDGHRDLAGNVWEWCANDDGPYKVVAGGSWYSRPQWVRNDSKYRFDPRNRYHDLGFRIARRLYGDAPRRSTSQPT